MLSIILSLLVTGPLCGLLAWCFFKRKLPSRSGRPDIFRDCDPWLQVATSFLAFSLGGLLGGYFGAGSAMLTMTALVAWNQLRATGNAQSRSTELYCTDATGSMSVPLAQPTPRETLSTQNLVRLSVNQTQYQEFWRCGISCVNYVNGPEYLLLFKEEDLPRVVTLLQLPANYTLRSSEELGVSDVCF